MKNGEAAAAVVFYLGIAALAIGAMLAARRAIERRDGYDRRAAVLIAVGVAGITIAVVIFASGPRAMLPF